jgi:hypothetical protein
MPPLAAVTLDRAWFAFPDGEDIADTTWENHQDRFEKLRRTFPQLNLNRVEDLKTIQRFLVQEYQVPENVYSTLRKLLRHVPGLTPEARAFGENLPLNIRRYRKLTDYEKKMWIPWADVVTKVDDFLVDMEHVATTQGVRAVPRKDMRDALLLSLYVYAEAPRRNDYRNMKTTKMDDGTSNYLDWPAKRFVFRDYKTAFHYGEQTFAIPPTLQRVLTLYRKRMGRQPYLFGDEPWSTSTFSNHVRAASKRILGKYIGSRFLRKMYATHHFRQRRQQVKQLRKQLRAHIRQTSTAMGNNMEQLHRAYIKEE